MSTTETASAPPAKKKGSKLLKLGVPILLLLAGGGGGGWWYVYGRASSTVQAAEPAPDPTMVSFEPFIVNLADPGGRRFLRVSLQLLVVGEHAAVELEEKKGLLHSRVRSALLELLTTQTSAGLATPEGRNALKKAIAETAAHQLEGTEVSDVLFAEFVVQ
jgi:flagellar FliL protein